MAKLGVVFQADALGLAAMVEQRFADVNPSPSWEQENAVRPLWLRVWRRGMRPFWRKTRGERARMDKQIRRIVSGSDKPLLVYLVPFDILILRTGGDNLPPATGFQYSIFNVLSGEGARGEKQLT